MSKPVFLIIDCEEEPCGQVVAVADTFALAKKFIDRYNERRNPVVPKKTLIIERHVVNGFLEAIRDEREEIT